MRFYKNIVMNCLAVAAVSASAAQINISGYTDGYLQFEEIVNNGSKTLIGRELPSVFQDGTLITGMAQAQMGILKTYTGLTSPSRAIDSSSYISHDAKSHTSFGESVVTTVKNERDIGGAGVMRFQFKVDEMIDIPTSPLYREQIVERNSSYKRFGQLFVGTVTLDMGWSFTNLDGSSSYQRFTFEHDFRTTPIHVTDRDGIVGNENQIVSILVPFKRGLPVSYSVGLTTYVQNVFVSGVYGDDSSLLSLSSPSASVFAYAHNSVYFDSVELFDQEGNVLLGDALVSTSGFDYSKSLVPAAAAVPEPTGATLFFVGVMGLAAAGYREKFARRAEQPRRKSLDLVIHRRQWRSCLGAGLNVDMLRPSLIAVHITYCAAKKAIEQYRCLRFYSAVK